ncbi:hypothetical protein D3C78_1037280 [compost metagenome]
MPLGQVDLPGIAEDVLTRKLGCIGVFGVLVDDGGVAGDDRPVRGDQHFEAFRVDLVAVAQAVEVPHNAHFDLAFFQGLDGRVGQRQALLLGQLGEQLKARGDVALIALVGDGCGQHAVGGLGGSTDIADGDLVLAFFQVVPGFRAFLFLHQVLVDDEGDGAGIGQRPVTILVLGPARYLVPGARFVRLAHALGHGNRAEGGTDVTDIGAGVVLLGIELGDFLGRAHVGVGVLEAVLAGQVFPGTFPVGPGIGHAHAVDRAFFAGSVFQGLEVGAGGHGRGTQGHGRAEQ